VVPIGGHVADIALDEARGQLYIANFAARRIDVMSTADNTLRVPISVPPFPSTLALSPDGRYLVVGHLADIVSEQGAVTVIDMAGSTRRTFTTASSVLTIGFGISPRALIVTTTGFQLLDPGTGTFTPIEAVVNLTADKLPVAFPKFPPQITKASLGVSGNGQVLYVLADTGGGSGGQVGTQALVRFDVATQFLGVVGITASPPLGPRAVSVNATGSHLVAGWSLIDSRVVLLAQFPAPTGALNLGSHAFDYSRNLIYGQIPVGTPLGGDSPGGGPAPGAPATPSTPSDSRPTLTLFDSDNLTVRERIQLKENLAGRSLLSADFRFMYAASDSGVTVLPVGDLAQAPRVVARNEAMVFRASACDNRVLSADLDILSSGSGPVDFRITGAAAGVRIIPSSGTAPARVRIEVDPTAFQNNKGTSTVMLGLTSSGAVNIPDAVKLLINTKEPEQRGAFAALPGKIVDILADPARDRFYVLRQDRNQLLVFDGSTFNLIAAFRTANTPTQMAITRDLRQLLVGHDNSQIATVYNLDTLQPEPYIEFPPGHYPRSIAVSNRSILSAVRSVAGAQEGQSCPGTHAIDRVDLVTRTATRLPSLGPYCNDIPVDTVLQANLNGEYIIGAAGNGTVMLYDSSVDSFTAIRKDLASASGALAALPGQGYFLDNKLLNWSLVVTGELDGSPGKASGFSFVDSLGLRTSARSDSTPGVIQRLDIYSMESIRPVQMIEAPLLLANLRTRPPGQIGQYIPPFLRTLAPLANRRMIVSLSTSGLTVLPWNFDDEIALPVISEVRNIADNTNGVAPLSLISIRGENLAAVPILNREVPVPTVAGEGCVTVNGTLLPVFSASMTEIRAQLPSSVTGTGQLVIRTPGGTSAPFALQIPGAAPAIFRTGSIPGESGLPLVFRDKNHELVTLANPIHPRDFITIFLTGLGVTSPPVEAGNPAPSDPLAAARALPEVTLGGSQLTVAYAGMVPDQVGVYQINAEVPEQLPFEGFEIPLVIRQAGYTTNIAVRVLK
jgi:uncharacterized protein (TIGR03437 family)